MAKAEHTSTNRPRSYTRGPRKDKPISTSADPPSPNVKLETIAINRFRQKEYQVLSKDLVLRVIIAKLEPYKICDWHELSLNLGTMGKTIEKTAKGNKVKRLFAWSGTELHEIYYNVSHMQ